MPIDHAAIEKAQRRQMMRSAEGYLDLIMMFDGRWTLDESLRTEMADQALSCLNRVKKPLGHKPYLLFLKGQAHRVCERHDKAINFLEQSAKLDPDSIHTYLALAWCYKRVDRIDKAIEAMETAVMLDEKNALAQYNLACYWALEGQAESAVKHLANAISLNSEYRQHVAGESDFDPIRDDPRFQDVLTVIV